ncbi:MAG: hypothetical protein NVV60_13880 [Luteimonas sp.]|nr:hypothetical protein [Luteimonas sp.]
MFHREHTGGVVVGQADGIQRIRISMHLRPAPCRIAAASNVTAGTVLGRHLEPDQDKGTNLGTIIQWRGRGERHANEAVGAMNGGQDTGAGHVAVLTTIRTSTGQVTLIVNDDSHWKANALSVMLTQAIGALAGMQPPGEAGASPRA